MTGKPLSPPKNWSGRLGSCKGAAASPQEGWRFRSFAKFGARGRLRHVEVRELVRKTFGLAPQTTLVVRVAGIGCILLLRSIADEKR